jgi:hypothetical protein
MAIAFFMNSYPFHLFENRYLYSPDLWVLYLTRLAGDAALSHAVCSCMGDVTCWDGSTLLCGATIFRVTLDATEGRLVACAVIVTVCPFGTAEGGL